MNEMIPRAEKLRRMYACDTSANGLFITGVITTGIYCLPSCPARKPKAENVRFFAYEHEARAVGLRPCKRCKPDQFYAGIDPEREKLLEVLNILQHDPANIKSIAEMARRVGIGQSKLYEIVERYFKTTPGELIHAYRIQRARHLLVNLDLGIAAIAFETGYESLSAFYKRFKQKTGLTPHGYRKRALDQEGRSRDGVSDCV